MCIRDSPYDGLVDKSLLEFEDALDELQRDVGDVSQLRDDMTALAGQVTEDQAAVEKAAKQVAADRQEVETAHGEVKDLSLIHILPLPILGSCRRITARIHGLFGQRL